MNSINLSLAGYSVSIDSEMRFSRSIYGDFRTNLPTDFHILLTESDLDFERSYGGKVFIKPEAILEKVADALILHDTLLIHGVALAFQGKAYIFTAPSRTGKTTHAELWLNHLSEAFIVNGDKPFLRFRDHDAVYACGSPWAGKENMYTNTMVPLKSIILMERAEENHMEQIPFAQAFIRLLQQVYRPDDEEKMRKTLRLMQRLNDPVSFWRFQCNNFKDDCFDVAYNALVRDQG